MKIKFHGHEKKSGIYKITNKVSGKFYIGSAKNFKIRYQDHLRSLNKNKHHNKHLQEDFIKYKSKNFEFEILELVSNDKKERMLVEQKYIDLYFDKQNKCYNINKKANSPNKRKYNNEIFNESQKNYIIKNYGKISAREIAKNINTSKQKIYQYCRYNKLEANKIGSYQKIKYNKNYFNTCNEKTCFWAGFIIADGSFVKNEIIKIDIATKNKNILIELANELEYTGTIKEYANGNSKQSRLILYQAYNAIKDIKRLQNTNKKHLFNSFINGYFLGKGSYKESKNYGHILTFSGKKHLLQKIKKQFEIKSNPIQNKNSKNSYKLIVKGKKAFNIKSNQLNFVCA